MKKKRLPIGTSDYKEIVDKNLYYVDKTMLIKKVIEGGKSILITRPRRFGKTLNQTTLRHFFEKTDDDTSYMFTDKKIWQYEEFRKMQGRYPVIYLSLKDIQGMNFGITYDAMQILIASEYNRHYYLFDSIENKTERDNFYEICGRKANYASLQNSLKQLSKHLYEYHGEKTIIIIDEYDTPIIESYQKGYYDEFIQFFKTFLGAALKDNYSLERSVITGITKVAKESIFSDLNNLKVSTILTPFFTESFGLMKEEVHESLDYYNLVYEEDKIIEWYNGYNIAGKDVYNPYSIINLLDNNGELKEYWVNSSGNEIIQGLISRSSAKFKDSIQKLMSGKSIESEINENLVFSDIEDRESNIWTLLLFSGYLTCVEKIGQREYTLRIPNKEVGFFYEYTVQNILKDRKIFLDNIIFKLSMGKIKTFKKEFSDLTKRTMSYFDTGGDNPEKFYHGLVLGMVIGLEKKYIIKSNREAGLGRADVILIPKDKKDKGIVLEFKKFDLDVDDDLMDSAKKGLKQIEEKKYIEEVKSYEINDVVAVSLAFSGKEVEIVSNIDVDKDKISVDDYSNKTQIKTAKNMLKMGLDISVISQATELSEEEIKKLTI